MFRGQNPAAQPRSLRSIAESKVIGSNMQSQSASPTAPTTYDDRAQEASTEKVNDASRSSSTSAEKSPFSNVR